MRWDENELEIPKGGGDNNKLYIEQRDQRGINIFFSLDLLLGVVGLLLMFLVG